MSEWFADDDMWTELFGFMFPPSSFEAAVQQVDRLAKNLAWWDGQRWYSLPGFQVNPFSGLEPFVGGGITKRIEPEQLQLALQIAYIAFSSRDARLGNVADDLGGDQRRKDTQYYHYHHDLDQGEAGLSVNLMLMYIHVVAGTKFLIYMMPHLAWRSVTGVA